MATKQNKLIKALRESGHPRQAVLIEVGGDTALVYGALLTETKLEDLVYPHLYKKQRDLYFDRLLAKHKAQSKFKPRVYETDSLEIRVESNLTVETVEDAAEKHHKLNQLMMQAEKLIYQEVEKQTKDSPDLLFEIYKDRDNITLGYFKTKLRLTLDTFSSPSPNLGLLYMEQALKARSEYLEIDYDKDKKYTVEELISKIDQSNKLIAEALEDEEKLNSLFERYAENREKTKFERVIEDGGHDISRGLDGTLYEMESDLVTDHATYKSTKELMKTPLDVRKEVLFYFNYGITELKNKLIGIQQLVAGGQKTNPLLSALSTKQNHGDFPNIPYSLMTLEKLALIANDMRQVLDDTPDISDMATGTKMRKKKDLTYIVEELPKDPLDITFGNDSECCLFVPEDADKMINGGFVPFYLADNNVRLFAVYRTENDKRQRMGLVLAFDTVDEQGNKVLAANSLELSRLGITGGKNTVAQIANYVENWLAGYAAQHGYQGVAMGNNDFNISQNHSPKKDDVVAGKLKFSGDYIFYSDIFKIKDDQLETRPNKMYWILKPTS